MNPVHDLPDIADVWAASRKIYSLVRRTPAVMSPGLTRISGAAGIHLKLEMLQPTGSFKVRGAANKILSLTEEQRARGVITFSTGNHGRAVSYAASSAGIRAAVCLSRRVPSYRVEAITSLGGEVIVTGASQDEAEDQYMVLKEQRGMEPVVPFDDPYIISGQGTISLEILQQVEEADTLLVPLSGGGLLAGMAMTVKALKPSVRVIGVSIKRSPAMFESLKAGHPVLVEEQNTLADSLLGGIGKKNAYTLELISRYVDDHIVVDEDDIIRGMYYCFSHHGLIVEGAAAVGIGAVLSGKADVRGKHAVLPITGCNVDAPRCLSVLMEEEALHGRR